MSSLVTAVLATALALEGSLASASNPGGLPGPGGTTPEVITPLDVLRERLNTADLDVLDASVFGDHVDIDSGRLTVTQTDVSVPGNSALAMDITRVLTETTNDMNGLPGPGDWDLAVPHIRQRFLIPNGPPQDRCTGFGGPSPTSVSYDGQLVGVTVEDYWSGLQLSIAGSDRTLLRDTNSPEFTGHDPRWVTSDHWMVECLPTTPGGHGEGFQVTDPTGTTYTLDHIVQRSTLGQGAVATNTSVDFAYVTRVEDVHGNWVDYSYSGARLISMTSNDGRAITLTWSGYELTRVSTNGRDWDYSGNRVDLPDGRYWDTTGTADFKTFIDAADPNNRTCFDVHSPITIRHPSGATAVFSFGSITNGRTEVPDVTPTPGGTVSSLPAGCAVGRLNNPSAMGNNAVIEKRVTIPGDASHSWTWSYSSDLGCYVGGCATFTSTKPRTLTYPDGHYVITDVNREFGWREGLIDEIRTYSDTGSLLSTQTFTHVQGHLVGSTPLSGWSTSIAPATMRHQTQVELTQDGEVYSRALSYQTDPAASDFAFGRPHTITASSTVQPGARTAAITYTHLTADWILGLTDTVTRNGLLIQAHGYDSFGLRTHTDEFGVRVADMAYNADGTLDWFEDGLGRRTTTANWKRGLPQLITRPDLTTLSRGVDNNGWVTSLTDPNGTTTAYTYSDVGWLTLINRPSGYADTSITYTGLGSGLTQTVETGALRIIHTLDGFHRPTRIERRAISGGGGSIFTRFEYDGLGRTVFESFPSASANPTTGVETTYDGLGRVIESRETVTPFATTSTAYLTHNRVRVTDPSGHITTTWRSGWGAPDDGEPVRIDHPEGLTTKMSYDSLGHILTARQYGSHSGFSVDEFQSWGYDGRRRVCRHVTPETGATLYTYDAAGQVLTVARGQSPTANCGSAPGSATTVHGYDVMGRLTSLNYPDSAPDVTMSYDANGNLLTADRGVTAWSYGYDAMNQLTAETLVVDARSYALSHEYQSDGRHSATIYPGGRRIEYLPDGHGRPTRTMHAGFSFVHSASYHPSGQLQTLNYANGLLLNHSFNARQQIIEVDVAGGGVTAFDHGYTYDAQGRVLDILVHMLPSENRSFTYDRLGRLSTASGPWGAASYTYDVLSNLRSKHLGADTVEIEYNASNQIHRTRDTRDGHVWRLYGHDARGNVLDNSRLQFTYDRSDQPTAISGAATGSFVYDAHNRRVKQTINGQTIYSVYGRNGTLFYRDDVSNGEVIEYLTFGSTTHVRLTTQGGVTQRAYMHNDHLGSASMQTNSARTIQWWESYSPFGEPQNNAAANADNQGYTGHIRDAATGLNYMQARYYDPVIGRFLSNDPVGFVEGGIGHFNRYAYTGNDPVNHTDPTGRAACPGLCGRARSDPSFYREREVLTEAAEAQLDNVHTGLDVAGLTPGVGIVADAANAGLYAARGDLAGAAVSGAAMVPVVGQAASGARLAAKGADTASGIVYRRTDRVTGRCYIGRCNNDALFIRRQRDHTRHNPDAEYDYDVIDRAEPGQALREAEQRHITAHGGPTNRSNPNGGTENRRNEIAQPRTGTRIRHRN